MEKKTFTCPKFEISFTCQDIPMARSKTLRSALTRKKISIYEYLRQWDIDHHKLRCAWCNDHNHECGHSQHRDLNAATNICNWGHQQWCIDHARQELPEVPVDVTADVLTNWGGSSASTMKQEAVGL
jgi:hypothetical protein